MSQQAMSQTTRRPTSQAVTHAPDLRRRILDASAALLESDGLAALSLREVARRADVTHQAPYHRFSDRESSLADLVTQGFLEPVTM
jgi:AcrR family transcriptional regulator